MIMYWPLKIEDAYIVAKNASYLKPYQIGYISSVVFVKPTNGGDYRLCYEVSYKGGENLYVPITAHEGFFIGNLDACEAFVEKIERVRVL